MRRFVLRALAVAAAAACQCGIADAAIICAADPSVGLGIDGAGGLLVHVDGVGVVNICSMSSAERRASKEACAAWYSALLTWRVTHAKASVYSDITAPLNSGVTDCPSLGAWHQRTPYFLSAQ